MMLATPMMTALPNDVALLMFWGKYRIIAAKLQHHYAEHNIISPTAMHY